VGVELRIGAVVGSESTAWEWPVGAVEPRYVAGTPEREGSAADFRLTSASTCRRRVGVELGLGAVAGGSSLGGQGGSGGGEVGGGDAGERRVGCRLETD
jgi:hypothetical protein